MDIYVENTQSSADALRACLHNRGNRDIDVTSRSTMNSRDVLLHLSALVVELRLSVKHLHAENNLRLDEMSNQSDVESAISNITEELNAATYEIDQAMASLDNAAQILHHIAPA